MRYDKLTDGALFVRPDTVDPGRIYRRKDATTYSEVDGWWYSRPEGPIRCKVEPVEVRTWADGYGLWHVRLTGPDLTGFRAEARHAAWSLVRDELQQRQGAPVTRGRSGVRCESLDLLDRGRVAIQFREV